MNLEQVIEERRSIRKYLDKEVPEEMVRKMIHAASLAPSGANSQPWRFVVIRSEKKRHALSEGTVKFVAEAPLVIACCIDVDAYQDADKLGLAMFANGVYDGVDLSTKVHDDYVKTEVPLDDAARRSYCMFNSAFAMENLVLCAQDLGLGTCIVIMYNQKILREILGLPNNMYVSALVSVGYPAQFPPQRPRLSVDDIYLKEI